MQIEVKGRNTTVSEDLREHVEKRFAKVGKQVSELAVLSVELSEEKNPANPDNYEWMSPKEFSRTYAPGWAVILLSPPPPKAPR